MNITSNAVLPLIQNEKKYSYIAEQAMSNVIEPFPNLKTITFSEDFDWNFTDDSSSDTYQLYLQSLRVVSYLLDYYREKKDINIIVKALEITESWIAYEDKGNTNNMTWYDHTTGQRTQTIIELLSRCYETGVEYDVEKYRNLINRHADVLYNDENHNNNNHALMMDRSLMMLGIVLENDLYIIKGLDRAKTVFWVSYSFKGVHLENSPAYHFMVSRMFLEIEEYLNKNNLTLGKEIIRMFPLMQKYKYYITKPNNFIPPIGDSARIKMNLKKYSWESFSDSDAGITIIKNQDNQLYSAFIAGYSSPTHKHSDDLSFVLNYNKKDFFEDAGLYAYGRNESRRYVKSFNAHNIFTVNKNYSKTRDNKITKEIYTDQYLNSRLFSIVSGHNYAFKDTKLRRTLYFLHDYNLIIIYDQGVSKEKQEWIHNFNLSEVVDILESENELSLVNQDESIKLKSINPLPYRVIHGDKTKFKALNSNKPRSFVETKQIRYKHESFYCEQLFVIEMNPSIYNIDTNKSTIIFSAENRTIELPIFNI